MASETLAIIEGWEVSFSDTGSMEITFFDAEEKPIATYAITHRAAESTSIIAVIAQTFRLGGKRAVEKYMQDHLAWRSRG